MNAPSQPYPGRAFGATGKSSAFGGTGRLVGGGGMAGPSAQQSQVQPSFQPQAPASMREEYFSQLSEEQRDEINEAFALFDVDKDSRIDYHEFKVALKALGFDLPKSDLLHLLQSHGQPPINWQPAQHHQPPPSSSNQQQQQQQPPQCPAVKLQLTLASWQQIAGRLVFQRDPRDEIMRAFALFDSDEKGLITLDDLRRVARELGEALEEEELAAMIEEFDLEGKGGVNQEEFISILLD